MTIVVSTRKPVRIRIRIRVYAGPRGIFACLNHDKDQPCRACRAVTKKAWAFSVSILIRPPTLFPSSSSSLSLWHCELQYTKVRSFLSLSLSYFISSISAFISFSTFFPSSLSPVPSSPSSFLPSFSYPNSSSSQSPLPSPTTPPSQTQLLILWTSMNWRQVFLHFWTSFSPHFCLNCLILILFSPFSLSYYFLSSIYRISHFHCFPYMTISHKFTVSSASVTVVARSWTNENHRSRVLYFSWAKDVAAEWLPHVKVASNKDSSTLHSRAIFYTSRQSSTLDQTVYLLYIYCIFLQGRLGMK